MKKKGNDYEIKKKEEKCYRIAKGVKIIKTRLVENEMRFHRMESKIDQLLIYEYGILCCFLFHTSLVSIFTIDKSRFVWLLVHPFQTSVLLEQTGSCRGRSTGNNCLH
jgi:hypothetical protein